MESDIVRVLKTPSVIRNSQLKSYDFRSTELSMVSPEPSCILAAFSEYTNRPKKTDKEYFLRLRGQNQKQVSNT